MEAKRKADKEKEEQAIKNLATKRRAENKRYRFDAINDMMRKRS